MTRTEPVAGIAEPVVKQFRAFWARVDCLLRFGRNDALEPARSTNGAAENYSDGGGASFGGAEVSISW